MHTLGDIKRPAPLLLSGRLRGGRSAAAGHPVLYGRGRRSCLCSTIAVIRTEDA